MSALQTIVLTQDNLGSVCRICLEKKPHLFSFRDAVAIEGEKFNPTIIADMLVKLTVGQIRQEKGLPKKICTTCVSLLQAAYVFQLKFQESTNILKFFMITTSDGQFQVTNNVSSSTKPVVSDTPKQNASMENISKVNDVQSNLLPQGNLVGVEPVLGRELQLEKVQKLQYILPKNDSTNNQPVLKENPVTKTNSNQDLQLLFPTNVCFKIESVAGSQIPIQEVQLLNLPKQNQSITTSSNSHKVQVTPQNVSEKAVLKQNIIPLTEPIGMANNIQKPPQNILQRRLLKKDKHPKYDEQTIGKESELQDTQNITCNYDDADPTVSIPKITAVASACVKNNSATIISKVDPKPRVMSYLCPICMAELPTPTELKQHVRNHKGFEKHLKVAALEKKVKFYAMPRNTVSFFKGPLIMHRCPYCNEEFTGWYFKTHVNNHTKEGGFKCNQCDRVFRRINNLNMHRIQHLKEYPFWCNTCEKGFVIKSNYECHMLTHTISVSQFPHECPHCYRRFSNPRHLHRHKFSHTDNVRYDAKYQVNRCNKCLKYFKSCEALSNHTCIPREVIVNTRFPCKSCKKVFKNASGLYCHLRYVHKQKQRQSLQGLCQICGQFVKNIYIHMKIHTQTEKTHQCVLCNKKFVSQSRLKQHVMIHTCEKQFKCTQCEKKFVTKQRLNRHLMAVHSTLRPYVCNACGKTFNDPNNLRVHERIHTGIKSHVCAICDKGFCDKSNLKKHYVNVHKVIQSV